MKTPITANTRQTGLKIKLLYGARNLLHACLSFSLLLTAFASFAMGQNTPEAPPTRVPEPIQLAEVAAQARQVSHFLKNLRALFSPTDEIEDINKNLPAVIAGMARQKQRTMEVLQEKVTLINLQTEGKIWQKNQTQMIEWQSIIIQRANQLESVLAQLADLQKKWNQTLDAATEAKAQEMFIQQINTTLQAIEVEQTSLQAEKGIIIDLESRIADGVVQCSAMLAQISQAQLNMAKGIVSNERMPIWSANLWAEARAEEFARLLNIAESKWADFELYLFGPSSRMPIHLGCFIFLLALLFLLSRKAGRWMAGEHSEAVSTINDRPFTVALIITLILASSPYLSLPQTMQKLFEVLTLVAIITLIKPMVDQQRVPELYALGFLYILDMIRNVFDGATFFDQSLIVVEATAGIVMLGYSLIYGNLKRPMVQADRLNRFRILRTGATIILSIFCVGLVTGILGYMNAARLLVSGVISTGVFALSFFAYIKITFGIAAFCLRLWPLRLLRMVNRHHTLLERRIYKVLVWGAIIGLLTRILEYVGLFQPVVSAGKAILYAKLERGAISISLADILAFVLCMWISYLLSAFINFVLAEEVYPRTKVPHGIVYAASRIIRYLIMAIGFVVGIGLLGMDLTKVTVLIGALGVGIGFGLQSVVNNFVSGLILLFERPIHASDIVEVGNIQGVVKRIGIRASILKTRQGSEVIIPNSHLVSEQVTNWTLSDQRRRIDLPVGVNYDSEPRKVIEVLSAVASDHPRVLKNPPLQVLLTGYGDSSINYELRVWTDMFVDWPVLRSELAVTVYDAIRRAGMSFPFPQREIRLLREKET